MYILVTNSATILNDHSMWSEIINNITRISGLKVKMKPKISSKTIFKYMDIIDILE